MGSGVGHHGQLATGLRVSLERVFPNCTLRLAKEVRESAFASQGDFKTPSLPSSSSSLQKALSTQMRILQTSYFDSCYYY